MNIIETKANSPLRDIHKIAVFRALQLGDMLCMIPAVRALKSTYPHAEITLIGLPWQHQFAKRFAHYFSDFIPFAGWPGLPEMEFNAAEVVEFLKQVQQRKFDLVMQMQGGGNIANPLCMLFGARYMAGLRKKDEVCMHASLSPLMQEDEHEIKRFIKLIQAVGAEPLGTELEFPFLNDELENFEFIKRKLNLETGKYICIHPGARDSRRRWPAENFALVADQLVNRGFKIMLTGSEEEQDLLLQVESLMHSPVKNLVREIGHVGVGELAAIIANSIALVSNDTGVSHIASALRVPSVVIFSLYSDPQRWAPLNKNLHVAISSEGSDPEKVLSAILMQIDENVLASAIE